MTITTFFYSTIIVIIVITSITYTIIFYRGFHINSKFYYWDIFPIMPLFFLICFCQSRFCNMIIHIFFMSNPS